MARVVYTELAVFGFPATALKKALEDKETNMIHIINGVYVNVSCEGEDFLITGIGGSQTPKFKCFWCVEFYGKSLRFRVMGSPDSPVRLTRKMINRLREDWMVQIRAVRLS